MGKKLYTILRIHKNDPEYIKTHNTLLKALIDFRDMIKNAYPFLKSKEIRALVENRRVDDGHDETMHLIEHDVDETTKKYQSV